MRVPRGELVVGAVHVGREQLLDPGHDLASASSGVTSTRVFDGTGDPVPVRVEPRLQLVRSTAGAAEVCACMAVAQQVASGPALSSSGISNRNPRETAFQ